MCLTLAQPETSLRTHLRALPALPATPTPAPGMTTPMPSSQAVCTRRHFASPRNLPQECLLHPYSAPRPAVATPALSHHTPHLLTLYRDLTPFPESSAQLPPRHSLNRLAGSPLPPTTWRNLNAMANPLTPLDAGIQDRLSKQGGVRCSLLPSFVETLSDYFAVFHSVVSSTDIFWFRGHADYTWSLTPSALRYETKSRRDKALALVSEFRRIAEIKLSRPPSDDEHLKWIQVCTPLRIADTPSGLDRECSDRIVLQL